MSHKKTMAALTRSAAKITRREQRKGYEKGFMKACTLIFGVSGKWPRDERRLCNRVTRQLFGKKRRS